MKWIKERVQAGELLIGTFNHLGSSFATELTAGAGFDFIMVDLEHGMGGRAELALQVQAMAASPTVPLVRVTGVDPLQIKRVLDLGVAGVMVPNVETAEDARRIVSAMRFPPEGTRGVASLSRCTQFGANFDAYFAEANARLLTIVQIESEAGLRNVSEIAAVEGVDMLFAGPLDLSVALGNPRQFEHPDLLEAMDRIVAACREAGKAPGVHAPSLDLAGKYAARGFRLITAGSDAGVVGVEMGRLAMSMRAKLG